MDRRILLASLALVAIASARAEQTINVTGDAEIKVVPDQVVISLGVEVHAKALDGARRDNDERVHSVREAVTRLGIADSDIQTDFIQLGIEYTGDGITPKYYYARKSIVLTLRDISKMEQVLGAAVDAGATHIHGVEFETTKIRAYRDRARAMAVQAATEKARDMAAAAGLKVVGGPTGISSAQYGAHSWYGSGWGYGPYNRGMMAQNVSIEAGPTGGSGQATVALGRISITASVAMQFRIE